MSVYKHALHDESARGLLNDATVEKAAYIVDSAGLPEMLEEWRLADKKGKGGRPAHIPMRAVLIGWLLLAMELQPMHVRQLSLLIHTRLTPKAAELLGIEHSPLAEVRTLEERVRTASTRIFNLVDAEPVSNRHRRQTMTERKRDLEWREKNADTIEVRRQRRDILQNALLEATYQLLPERYRPDRVSVTVDATRFKLHARGVGKKRLEVMPDDGLISVEPDAGYYKRDSKGNIPDPNSKLRPRISEYALEAEFAVLSSNDPSRPHAVPNIVMAYGVHIPGQQPVKAARRMVDSLWSRGHEIDHFAGDRAYLPAGDPNVLQNPLRLRGAKLLMDYPIDQLGQQATKHGAILVEGTWYSPGMPKRLIDATKVYREALKADEKDPNLTAGDRRERAIALERTWRAHLEQRSQYQAGFGAPAKFAKCGMHFHEREKCVFESHLLLLTYFSLMDSYLLLGNLGNGPRALENTGQTPAKVTLAALGSAWLLVAGLLHSQDSCQCEDRLRTTQPADRSFTRHGTGGLKTISASPRRCHRGRRSYSSGRAIHRLCERTRIGCDLRDASAAPRQPRSRLRCAPL